MFQREGRAEHESLTVNLPVRRALPRPRTSRAARRPAYEVERADIAPGDPALLGSASSLLTALPVAIYTTDAEGILTFYNQAAASLWGWRPVIGRAQWCGSWRMLALDGSPLPHDQIPSAIALKTAKPHPAGEHVVLRPDGTTASVASSSTLMRDSAGNIIGAINMLTDLTRVKAAEAALDESEKHGLNGNRLKFQMAWTADAEGQILEFSEQWCTLTGQTPEAARGNGWLATINPEDIAGLRASMRSSLSFSEPHDVRFRLRTAAGEERWMRSRAIPHRDAAGAIIRWYGSTEDIQDVLLAAEARDAGERHRLAFEGADDVAWDLDFQSNVVTWGSALRRRFGLWPQPAQSNPAWWMDQIHPDDRARVASVIAATMAGETSRLRAEYRFRRADGSYAHVVDRGSVIRDKKGQVVRAIGAMIDLTERRRSDEALRLSEERFRLAATAAGLGVADIDLVAGVEHWSAEMRAMLGVSKDLPALPETYSALIHADDRARTHELHERALRGELGDPQKSEHRIIRPIDGALRWIATERHAMRSSDGDIVRAIVTQRDITEEKTAQDRINWAATHDAVTGLENRTVFQVRLDQALADGRKHRRPVSVLLMDLDNFKHINDSLGHQAGDRALQAFAKKVGEAMPNGAIVVRFGGDEFAVILPATSAAAAAACARDILAGLRHPVSIGDRKIDLNASIGVSTFPDQKQQSTDLIQNADLALYEAKKAGGSKVRSFESSFRADLQRQISMLSQARVAIDRGWIEPYYQPKIELATGRVAGFEALLRWRHPGSGLQFPESIAGAFEDTELAESLGEAMLEAVLADMRSWLDTGLTVGKIAINASAAEFRKPGFAERFLERLNAFLIPAAMIELEITETAFLGDCAANVLFALEMLRAAGVTIALDDFGTGFSSLAHLRNFPVDTIKIDRSFVAGLGESAADRAIIEAVLRLGEALGMTTVGEGVETRAQADYLAAHGCTLAQGYLFAPAVQAAAVPAALAAGHALPFSTSAG